MPFLEQFVLQVDIQVLKPKDLQQETELFFFRSFPLLTGFTIITLVTALLFVFFTILQNHTSDRISKIMDIEFSLKDIIIPFLIMIGISLPISIMNYKTASIELKNTYPFLNISILLMAVFNSLTISLIISLLLKR